MIKNTFDSFTDNINQKLKNPFLGTFIIVWLIRNWEFVYSIFYFDSKLSLDDRLTKIKTFFINYGIFEILITIGYSFLVLIVTYILLNLSRLIVNFFDKMITPKVYEYTDKSSVVLKSDFIETKKILELLESKVNNERELRLKTQNENEQLEQRIKELVAPKSKLTAKKIDQNISTKPKETTKSKLLTNKLITDNNVDIFKNVASDILNNNLILKEQPHIKEFSTIGLIKQANSYGSGKYTYNLTPIGSEVHEKLLLDGLK